MPGVEWPGDVPKNLVVYRLQSSSDAVTLSLRVEHVLCFKVDAYVNSCFWVKFLVRETQGRIELFEALSL